jgi:hypothetical protein
VSAGVPRLTSAIPETFSGRAAGDEGSAAWARGAHDAGAMDAKRKIENPMQDLLACDVTYAIAVMIFFS